MTRAELVRQATGRLGGSGVLVREAIDAELEEYDAADERRRERGMPLYDYGVHSVLWLVRAVRRRVAGAKR